MLKSNIEVNELIKLSGIGLGLVAIIWIIGKSFGNVEINIAQTLIQGITTAVALGIGNHFIVEKYIKRGNNYDERLRILEEKLK
jgi:hypothetical protein